jgi:outer membrane murein-binding lipoprotein Lpp
MDEQPLDHEHLLLSLLKQAEAERDVARRERDVREGRLVSASRDIDDLLAQVARLTEERDGACEDAQVWESRALDAEARVLRLQTALATRAALLHDAAHRGNVSDWRQCPNGLCQSAAREVLAAVPVVPETEWNLDERASLAHHYNESRDQVARLTEERDDARQDVESYRSEVFDLTAEVARLTEERDALKGVIEINHQEIEHWKATNERAAVPAVLPNDGASLMQRGMEQNEARAVPVVLPKCPTCDSTYPLARGHGCKDEWHFGAAAGELVNALLRNGWLERTDTGIRPTLAGALHARKVLRDPPNDSVRQLMQMIVDWPMNDEETSA